MQPHQALGGKPLTTGQVGLDTHAVAESTRIALDKQLHAFRDDEVNGVGISGEPPLLQWNGDGSPQVFSLLRLSSAKVRHENSRKVVSIERD